MALSPLSPNSTLARGPLRGRNVPPITGLVGIALLLTTLSGCGARTPWMPLRQEVTSAPSSTLVWVGRGECERLEDGRWVRRPEFDYEFSVEQRRNPGNWESVKSLRRLHPAYDGSAGPRAQTYYFDVTYSSVLGERVTGELVSSLGHGSVETDPEFRTATIEIAAEVSSFAPFDRYRITQSYGYERGQLDEIVELNQGTHPWVRNREHATLFGPTRYDAVPR